MNEYLIWFYRCGWDWDGPIESFHTYAVDDDDALDYFYSYYSDNPLSKEETYNIIKIERLNAEKSI